MTLKYDYDVTGIMRLFMYNVIAHLHIYMTYGMKGKTVIYRLSGECMAKTGDCSFYIFTFGLFGMFCDVLGITYIPDFRSDNNLL